LNFKIILDYTPLKFQRYVYYLMVEGGYAFSLNDLCVPRSLYVCTHVQ
jgi:hypothetical protein